MTRPPRPPTRIPRRTALPAQLLRPLARPVTYTRWLHLAVPMAFFSVWLFIDTDRNALWVPALLVVPLGLLRWMRQAEATQAQLLLEPHERSGHSPAIPVAPAATWPHRWRTVLWLEARLLLSLMALIAAAWLPIGATGLMTGAVTGDGPGDVPLLTGRAPQWWWALGTPMLLVAAVAALIGVGALEAALARRLLGPSVSERLAAFEVRTERLLEHNRIAGELHDSIGHALTVAVVQAGAARAAGRTDLTVRALATIEETGRTALEDLERVLLVLRGSEREPSPRPTLAEADRLWESARASGAVVDATVVGPVGQVPGPVSREGYRILQEALTNVLRHSGSVPVRLSVEVTRDDLTLVVTNPTSGPAPDPADEGTPAGRGLRGIRERATLLGGEARAGLCGTQWRVAARLPLHSTDRRRAAPTPGPPWPMDADAAPEAARGR